MVGEVPGRGCDSGRADRSDLSGSWREVAVVAINPAKAASRKPCEGFTYIKQSGTRTSLAGCSRDKCRWSLSLLTLVWMAAGRRFRRVAVSGRRLRRRTSPASTRRRSWRREGHRSVRARAQAPPSGRCSTRQLICSPVAVSQIRTVPSSLPVASQVPSGWNATDFTQLVWPVRVRRCSPVAASQIRTVPSPLPVASQVPSGCDRHRLHRRCGR